MSFARNLVAFCRFREICVKLVLASDCGKKWYAKSKFVSCDVGLGLPEQSFRGVDAVLCHLRVISSILATLMPFAPGLPAFVVSGNSSTFFLRGDTQGTV